MTSDQLFSHITQCLDNKTPVSICRYGDGESFVLNGYHNEENFRYVLERQLGVLPDPLTCKGIRTRLIEAYTNCDIIGIPVNNRYMKDSNSSWAKARGILERDVDLTGKILSDIDFHSHFLDRGYFDDLFNSVSKVFYVSCRNIQSSLLAKYDNLKTVQGFHIAPEMKFTGKYTGTPHLKDIDNVKRWIESTNVKGQLCLFGAGVVGKIYGNWFRDAGGIAIDCGSVFDSWQGLKTRGQGRGVDVIDKTFKL